MIYKCKIEYIIAIGGWLMYRELNLAGEKEDEINAIGEELHVRNIVWFIARKRKNKWLHTDTYTRLSLFIIPRRHFFKDYAYFRSDSFICWHCTTKTNVS